MAAAGFVALFRSCMDSLKSILTSQEFGAEYEVLCTEFSLQCLRFRLWGDSVGMNNASNSLPAFIINRRDIQPTFDQAVGSIKYLLDEVEQLRQKYQLNQQRLGEERFNDGAKTLRASKSISSLSSLRSTLTLRQRIRQNQKQKPFLAIAKWAICDARRFDEKVRKIKSLIDSLEDITKAALLSHSETSGTHFASTLLEETPPPYSAAEPVVQPQPESFGAERVYPPPEAAVPTYSSLSDASLLILSEYVRTMKRFLALWPDESGIERPQVRDKLLALSHLQFLELSEDVHDELLRRQRYDGEIPEWLPPKASFHPRRNDARKKLSTLHVFRFPHLIADTVFEFERRFPDFQDHAVHFRSRNVPLADTFLPHQDTRRWGLCSPHPPLLQYRPAHRSTNVDPASLAPISIFRVPTSIFNDSQLTALRAQPPSTPYIFEDSETTSWPLDRVILWLEDNGFSSDWRETFKALNISGSMFLDLGNGHGGRGNFGLMHQQIYPRLAQECSSSGSGWDQTRERDEGKRLRRLIRKIKNAVPTDIPKPLAILLQNAPQWTRHRSNPSTEIFKTFRVSTDDSTSKVLPAALREYHINGSPEQYLLYIVYEDWERCLGMEEKPLMLFKQLEKAGKKPMFMLRKIATPGPAMIPDEAIPGGLV